MFVDTQEQKKQVELWKNVQQWESHPGSVMVDETGIDDEGEGAMPVTYNCHYNSTSKSYWEDASEAQRALAITNSSLKL
jgi:hypothetical protein